MLLNKKQHMKKTNYQNNKHKNVFKRLQGLVKLALACVCKRFNDKHRSGSALRALGLGLFVQIFNKLNLKVGSALRALGLGLLWGGVVIVILVTMITSTVVRMNNNVVNAAPNAVLNFQARLMTNTGQLIPDGFYNAEFRLYDAASSGNLLWTETYYDSNGVTAGNDNRIRVQNGYLTANLGSLTAFGSSIDWSQQLWLSINIGGTAQTATPTWDGEMNPRLQVTAVPYAFAAETAENVKSTDVDSTDSADVNISTGAATTSGTSGDIIVDNGVGATANGGILLGATNASSIQIGRSGLLTQIDGTLDVAEDATFNGDLTVAAGGTFTNAGATVLSAIAISDVAAGGNIGTAATTVDIATTFNVNQTTTGQTLTLPSPTNTAAGRLAYVNNIGSAEFTMYGNPISAGSTASFIWNGTAWVQTISFSTAGNILQGGNTFGQAATIGTNDGFSLNFETNNTIAVSIDTSQNVTFNGDVTVAASQTITFVGDTTVNRPSAVGAAGTLYYDTDTDTLLVSDGTKWMADRGEYIIVAANDSTQVEKDAADYVADGTSDEDEINSALTAAAGGKVLLLAGTYVADGTVLIPNNTTLAGVGNGTVIEFADIDSTDNLIENSDTTTGTGIVIRDIRLDGRSDLNTVGLQIGIYLDGMGNAGANRVGAQIINVILDDFANSSAVEIDGADNNTIAEVTFIGAGTGVNVVTGVNNKVSDSSFYDSESPVVFQSGNNTIADSYFDGGSGSAITFNNGTNNIATGNRILNSGTSGISVQGSDNTISNNSITGVGVDGILLGGSSDNIITNNYISGSSANGINLSGGSNNTLVGNQIQSSGTNGVNIGGSNANTVSANRIVASTDIGLGVFGSTDNIISSNYIADNGSFGINVSGGANNTISSNRVENNAAATSEDGIYTVGAAGTKLLNNDITDTAGSGYAINVDSGSSATYLSGNTYSGTGAASINNGGTNTIFAGQLGASGNYAIQPTGSIELLTNTNITGNLDVTGAATFDGNVTLGDASGDTLVVNAGSIQFANNFTSCTAINTDASGNLGCDTNTYLTSSSAFVQGGNIFGAPAILGTNDAFGLTLEVGGNSALTIADGGAITLQNEVDSTAGFQILDADGGTAILTVDTQNERVGIGTSAPIAGFEVATDVTVASNRALKWNAYYNGANDVYLADGSAVQQWQDESADFYRFYAATAGTAGNAISFQEAFAIDLNTATLGDVTFDGGTLYVDASANAVSIGNSGTLQVAGLSTFDGDIRISDGSANYATIDVSALAGDYTISIPTVTGNDEFCLRSTLNCTGAGTNEIITVAADDSSADAKAAADYVADGTSDQTEINAALTAAAGGRVVLLAGTYVADGTIFVPNDTTLSGEGNGSVIEVDNIDVSDNLIENTDTTTGTGVVIRDLKLDGRNDLNTAGNQYGIYFTNMGESTTDRPGATVETVTIVRFRGGGVVLGSSDNSIIANSTLNSQTSRGIIINAGSTNNTIDSNVISGNGGYGIRIDDATYNIITSNVLDGNHTGVFLETSANFNTINGNSITNSTNDGMRLLNSDRGVISDNVIDNSTDYGIYLDGSSSPNRIIGNSITYSGLDGIVNYSTGTIMSGNTVYGGDANGIYVVNGSGNSVTNNFIQGNAQHGIYLDDANNTIVSSNRIRENGAYSSYSGIYVIDHSDGSQITDNLITDDGGTGYAIDIADVDADNIYLADNTYSGTGATTINNAGTNTIYGGQSAAAGGLNTVFRQANSATAFAVQNASGTSILNVNTSTTGVTVAGTLTVSGANATTLGGTLAVTGTSTFTGLVTANGGLTVETGDTFTFNGDAFTDFTGGGLYNNSGLLSVTNTGASGFFQNGGNSFGQAAILGTNDAYNLELEVGGNTVATFINSNGSVSFQNSADSTNGFEILDTAGQIVFNINTSAGSVGIGEAGTKNGALVLYNSTNSFGVTISAANQTTGSATISLPDTAGVSDTLALLGINQTFTAQNIFQNAANSTTAFQVNSQAGSSLLEADTTNFLLKVAPTQFISSGSTQNFATNGSVTGIDSYSTVAVNATVAGVTVTVPAPAAGGQVVGRVIYVTAVNGSQDFVLSLAGTSIDINMKANSTATLIWNGTGWTAAGASSSTDLQAAYDNTAATAGGAEIVLSSAGTGGLTIRNDVTTPITGGLLEVQNSIGSNLFTVNNNATEYANNGGAEGSTFTMWTTAPTAGGSVTRYTTVGDNIATGTASVFVNSTSTANTGARNTLTTTLTRNLRYRVSFAIRHTSSTSIFNTLDVRYSPTGTNTDIEDCSSGNTVNFGQWTRVTCTFVYDNATNPTASNAILFTHSDGVDRDYYIDNLSVTVSADVNHAADGSVEDTGNFATNWQDYDGGAGSTTETQITSIIYDGTYSAAADTTNNANQGLRNNMAITPTPNTQYLVTFFARSTNTFNDIRVRYSRDGGTNFVSCTDYNTQAVSTSAFTEITCLFTTDGTTATNPDLIIDQPTGSDRIFYVDALSITLNTNNSNNVQIGGGNKGGPVTLFTLDRSAGAPIANNNDAYLGSMYYDTTTGRIQCYEADGWGACGAAPDNVVNLNPEYSGAVLNGSGVGTMTADFCSNDTALSINTSLCDTGEAKNFYRWTSPQATQQTYSIYVTYQLPETFNGFANDDTVQLVARVDNTTNASVTYEMFKSTGSAVTQCGSGETNVITGGGGAADTWYSYGINGNEATGCSFNASSAGNFVIFKINMKANSNANAYVSTLSFTTTGR